MARIDSNALCVTAGRSSFRFKALTAIFGALRLNVRRLDEVPRDGRELNYGEPDTQWLDRVDLRSLRAVNQYLRSRGFNCKTGILTALFVDNRCGLISAQAMGSASPRNPEAVVRRILLAASAMRAHGILLATHDPHAKYARTQRCRQLTDTLAKKSEAAGIFLLNHLVLTVEGWRSLPLMRGAREGILGSGIKRPIRDRIRTAFHEARECSPRTQSHKTIINRPGCSPGGDA